MVATFPDDSLRALLRVLREESGLRQADLADKLGVPQSFVSKYESGERRLEFVAVQRICGALGLSLSDFVTRLERGAHEA